MKEETAMDKITTDMAEHICGDLCRHPYEKSQGELDDICACCGMSRYVCDILNEYNRLNDFGKSQCADLLVKLGAEREKRRWIPVEERLPEKDDYYLCTYTVLTENKRKCLCHELTYESGEWYFDGDCQDNICEVDGEVIAWMKLPESYKPEVLAEAGESAGSYADNDTLAPAT